MFVVQTGVPDDSRHPGHPAAPPEANHGRSACLQHRHVQPRVPEASHQGAATVCHPDGAQSVSRSASATGTHSTLVDWKTVSLRNEPLALIIPTMNCVPQSPGPETAQNKSKETSPVLLCTEALPDGNFAGLLESDADMEQTHAQNNMDGPEQQQHQHPLRYPSGRQASLPDVPSSSGMLGLHRPVSDPGLPGK